MGPEFFQTMMGRKFYDGDFPELVRQLKRLNDNLEKPKVKESPMQEALRLDKEAKSEPEFLQPEPEPAVGYALTEEEWKQVLSENHFNEALVLVQDFIGQPDGGVASVHFSGFEDDDRGQVKDWEDVSKRKQLILDYLKTEDSYAELEDEPTPISITRYTPDLKNRKELEEQGFWEHRMDNPVIAVLGILLPKCGELYISEYESGKFWTIAGQRDEFGTLDQCIKLLKEEFI